MAYLFNVNLWSQGVRKYQSISTYEVNRDKRAFLFKNYE